MPDRPSDNTLLIELGDIHRRLNDGHLYRLRVAADNETYLKATRRWYERVSEYSALLYAFRTTHTPDEIGAMRTDLEARLERGWLMDGSPDVDEQFSRLLGRLEAVTDALYGLAWVERSLLGRSGYAIRAWLRMLPEGDRKAIADGKDLPPATRRILEPLAVSEDTQRIIRQLEMAHATGTLPTNDKPILYRPGHTIPAGRLAWSVAQWLKDYTHGSEWTRSIAAVHLAEIADAIRPHMESEAAA